MITENIIRVGGKTMKEMGGKEFRSDDYLIYYMTKILIGILFIMAIAMWLYFKWFK